MKRTPNKYLTRPKSPSLIQLHSIHHHFPADNTNFEINIREPEPEHPPSPQIPTPIAIIQPSNYVGNPPCIQTKNHIEDIELHSIHKFPSAGSLVPLTSAPEPYSQQHPLPTHSVSSTRSTNAETMSSKEICLKSHFSSTKFRSLPTTPLIPGSSLNHLHLAVDNPPFRHFTSALPIRKSQCKYICKWDLNCMYCQDQFDTEVIIPQQLCGIKFHTQSGLYNHIIQDHVKSMKPDSSKKCMRNHWCGPDNVFRKLIKNARRDRGSKNRPAPNPLRHQFNFIADENCEYSTESEELVGNTHIIDAVSDSDVFVSANQSEESVHGTDLERTTCELGHTKPNQIIVAQHNLDCSLTNSVVQQENELVHNHPESLDGPIIDKTGFPITEIDVNRSIEVTESSRIISKLDSTNCILSDAMTHVDQSNNILEPQTIISGSSSLAHLNKISLLESKEHSDQSNPTIVRLDSGDILSTYAMTLPNQLINDSEFITDDPGQDLGVRTLNDNCGSNRETGLTALPDSLNDSHEFNKDFPLHHPSLNNDTGSCSDDMSSIDKAGFRDEPDILALESNGSGVGLHEIQHVESSASQSQTAFMDDTLDADVEVSRANIELNHFSQLRLTDSSQEVLNQNCVRFSEPTTTTDGNVMEPIKGTPSNAESIGPEFNELANEPYTKVELSESIQPSVGQRLVVPQVSSADDMSYTYQFNENHKKGSQLLHDEPYEALHEPKRQLINDELNELRKKAEFDIFEPNRQLSNDEPQVPGTRIITSEPDNQETKIQYLIALTESQSKLIQSLQADNLSMVNTFTTSINEVKTAISVISATQTEILTHIRSIKSMSRHDSANYMDHTDATHNNVSFIQYPRRSMNANSLLLSSQHSSLLPPSSLSSTSSYFSSRGTAEIHHNVHDLFMNDQSTNQTKPKSVTQGGIEEHSGVDHDSWLTLLVNKSNSLMDEIMKTQLMQLNDPSIQTSLDVDQNTDKAEQRVPFRSCIGIDQEHLFPYLPNDLHIPVTSSTELVTKHSLPKSKSTSCIDVDHAFKFFNDITRMHYSSLPIRSSSTNLLKFKSNFDPNYARNHADLVLLKRQVPTTSMDQSRTWSSSPVRYQEYKTSVPITISATSPLLSSFTSRKSSSLTVTQYDLNMAGGQLSVRSKGVYNEPLGTQSQNTASVQLNKGFHLKLHKYIKISSKRLMNNITLVVQRHRPTLSRGSWVLLG